MNDHFDFSLQKRTKIWQENNFGIAKQENHMFRSLLGMIEEVGELSHSVLKQVQSVRVDEDHEKDQKDAIGDITIFLLNFMNDLGIKAEFSYTITVDEKVSPKYHLVIMLSKEINKLVDLFDTYDNRKGGLVVSLTDNDEDKIKKIQKNIFNLLATFAYQHFEIDFSDLVISIWDEVSKRDWKNNKVLNV